MFVQAKKIFRPKHPDFPGLHQNITIHKSSTIDFESIFFLFSVSTARITYQVTQSMSVTVRRLTHCTEESIFDKFKSRKGSLAKARRNGQSQNGNHLDKVNPAQKIL